MNIHLGEVGHIIQLSVAPVFLLSGIGTNLMVQTTRLTRIVDRARVVEEKLLAAASVAGREFDEKELDSLYRRRHLINYAITLNVVSALMICLVIASLFVGDALELELATVIASLFVLAILMLIGSLIYLLREIFVATAYTFPIRRYPLNQ